ncbi:hypothetical protein R3P38DRAFT_2554134, partial [Favolaschia claudopus]
PFINYDVSLPLSTITTGHRGVSRSMLQESAFSPPQLILTLVSARIPCVIRVAASNGHYVTIHDVFTTLYTILRINVTLEEYKAAGDRTRRMVCEAYRQRYRLLIGGDYVAEKSKGIKRVDFLMGKTVLLGVSPCMGEPGVWRLKTRYP